MIHEGLEGREEDWGIPDAEEVSRRAIGLAIEIHKTVGPGLFAHIHEDCLSYELSRSGPRFERQVV